MAEHVKRTTRFHLETPYDSPSWPEISSNDQDTILELLCSLITPIGLHRQNHITPSKGKRSKKRKRQDATNQAPPAIPPTPEIASQILIGFNSITRHLQTLSQESRLIPVDDQKEDAPNNIGEENPSKKGDQAEKTKTIAAIFTTNPSPTHSILHSHFPLLVNTATLSHPDREPTRLVQLPKGCEGRLAAVLSLPRVNFIAVMEEAAGSEVLVGLVREKVGVVGDMGLCVPGGEAKYQGVRIVGVEGAIGMARRRRMEMEKEKREGGEGEHGKKSGIREEARYFIKKYRG